MEKKYKYFLHFIIWFGSITFAVYIGFANILGGFEYFSEPMKNAGIYGPFILILLSIIIGIVGAIIKVGVGFGGLEYKEPQNQPTNAIALPSAMVDQVEEYAKHRDYTAAIRLYRGLSRPLWLDGQYKQRIRLGEIIFMAGSAVGNKEVQVQALIDDLGWTYVMLNNCNEAKKNINHGLKIAEEIKDFYLIAKANRHLAGIATKSSMFQDAKKSLLAAEEAAKKVTYEKSRTEMLAGIQFGLAGVYQHMGELNEAEIACRSAQKAFREMNDSERLSKTYSLLGQIYLDKNLNREALSTFSEGLEVSKRQANRKDEIVRNLMGIARAHLSELKTQDAMEDAMEKLEEAKNIADSIGLVVERDEAIDLIQKIKRGVIWKMK